MPRVQAAPRAHSAAGHAHTRPVPDRAATRSRPVTERVITRDRRAEARRRQRHFRRRRRDLVTDATLGLLLAIVLISVTAGLGILLLLVMPLGGALVALTIAERRVARRRRATRSRSPHH